MGERDPYQHPKQVSSFFQLLYSSFILFSTRMCFPSCSGQRPPDFSDLQEPFDTPVFNKLYKGTSSFLLQFRSVLLIIREQN